MIRPISPTVPACHGVLCPQHAQCARYAASEGACIDITIGTCDEHGQRVWPLFVPVYARAAAPGATVE